MGAKGLDRDGPDVLARLKPFTAFGGITLYSPSVADAVSEARANEESQVYFGRGAVSLHEGAQRAAVTGGGLRSLPGQPLAAAA
jgi:hypothetical protein